MERLYIPVVLGNIRKGRRSQGPAQVLAARVAAAGHDTDLVDLKELALPLYDEEEASERHPGVQALRAAVARSHAQVWLTPEYNHGPTAAIKNAIDYLGREIRRKPAAVCGLSRGPQGGPRGVEQFKANLLELMAVPIRTSVYFRDARSHDDGSPWETPEWLEQVDYMVADLAWYARALAWGRQNLPIPERRR